MRLAFFVDQVFWRDGPVLSTDESYILFLASFADFVDHITFIGREAPQPGRAPYVLDGSAFSLCAMPYYPDLYQLWRADPRIYGRIRAAVREQARNWDAIVISGPHPIGQLVARECIALGIPVILMVRQNFIEQMSAHRGLKGHAAVLAARLLEWDFKRMARGRTVFTVGREMAESYGQFGRQVHNHFPCLVDRAQFDMFSKMSAGSDPTRLINVCRLAPEKGHRFLFEAMARLKQQGLYCHLDVVGVGAMDQELRELASALGIALQVTLHGYVPYGRPLFALYEQAGAMVLSSTTEGFPQVINESLSIGLPTVATTVGGIPSFLTDGETAMLVPPRDVPSLACAIEKVVQAPQLRERLRRNGRALMQDNTLEANRARILGGLNDAIARHRA
ncbi:MAG: glycosyltransferase [Bosea sp. (in: a-proteobacteria)]